MHPVLNGTGEAHKPKEAKLRPLWPWLKGEVQPSGPPAGRLIGGRV